MARIAVIPAAQVQAWMMKITPQFLLSSVWAQFSNQYNANMPIPKQGPNVMPGAIVMKITDDFKNGSFRTTMITLIKGGITPIVGPNVAAGNEARATMQECGLFYNVERIPRVVGDESVEGDVGQYFKLAEQTAGQIAADMVQANDYHHQRATVEGADVRLTDASYWQNSEKGSSINAPLSAVLHPNIYCWVNASLTLNTWSATDATARTNLGTLVATMDLSDTFNMALLDRICYQSTKIVARLPGMQGEKEVGWVLKISNAQWLQLMLDSAAGSLQDRLKYTDTEISKVVTGYIGVYRNVMIVADQLSPLINLSTGQPLFQYATSAADNRVPVLPGASSSTTGTFEIAMLYGNGALGMAVKSPLDYVKQDSMDYAFESSICGVRKEGIRRADWDATDAATSARRNFSSILFVTATNSTT
jgi:histone H3/H4